MLDDGCLIGVPQFGLQLLNLLLVPACFLLALLATGGPIVLKRLVRVLQLLLERLAEAFVFGKPHGLVMHLLRKSFDVNSASLRYQTRFGVRILFARERAGRVGQLRLLALGGRSDGIAPSLSWP